MNAKVREFIVNVFKNTGKPQPLEDIAKHHGVSVDELRTRLDTSPRLSSLLSLSPSQVTVLIDYYGKGILFEESIEKTVESLDSVSGKIRSIESKASPDRTD